MLPYAGLSRFQDAAGRPKFGMMISRRQASAFVALAAAYAVVLQAVLLAICGSLAEGQAFGAASLCTPSQGGERKPAPAGHGEDCLSACLACYCGMAATPAPGQAKADPRGSVRDIVPPTLMAVAAPLRTDWAHRSRGPPSA